MSMKTIKGSTHYITGGTNTGVYILSDNNVVIVDPGLIGRRIKSTVKMLKENELNVSYIILTHEHNDHYAACSYFKECFENVVILSSESAKLYIEQPELFSKYIIGGKSNRLLDDILSERSSDNINVDGSLEEGIIYLGDTKFNIFNFYGHTPGSIGVMTEDKVIFVGDHLIGKEMLIKYDFLFLFDILEYKLSLNKLDSINFDYLVTGHGKNILSKIESKKLIHMHKCAIEKYINQVMKIIINPTTLENILKTIITDNDFNCDYKKYHYLRSSLISLISYLVDNDKVDYKLIDGELLYYTKIK